MGRAAADHSTEGDDGVVLAAFYHLLADQRNLKRARDPGNIDLVFIDLMTLQPVKGAGHQLADDKFVEPCRHDTDPDVSAYHMSFESTHLISSCIFDLYC